MSDQKDAYPYPAQGYYQGPPVTPPNDKAEAKPEQPKKEPSFMDNFLACLPCGRPTAVKNDS